MKRGKDEEKIMGPMFPRLHINDTDKGGPRAPPRNKMALYEQLTIPSHRYNGGVPPQLSSNSNLAPTESTSQGTSHEKTTHFPCYQPILTPSHPANKLQRSNSVKKNSLGEERRQKIADAEDFTVPIFPHRGMDQYNGIRCNTISRERHMTVTSSNSPNGCDKERNRTDNGFNSKQDITRQERKESKEIVATMDRGVTIIADLPLRDMTSGSRQQDGETNLEDRLKNRTNRLHDGNSCLGQVHEHVSPSVHYTYAGVLEGSLEPSRGAGTGTTPWMDPSFLVKNVDAISSEMNQGGQSKGDEMDGSFESDMDKWDSDSETSMVDSLSGSYVSPDDVVGIIGLKHFWKARRAIANQQRLFAVQVFELHRLIKVQKLIAGSPHLLTEGSAYSGKSSLNGSSLKKLPADDSTKPMTSITKRKDESRKTIQTMEGSAENALAKSAVPPLQNGGYPSSDGFTLEHILSMPMPTDAKMNPWRFPHPSGHQFLVPVISPSEGLVYKPYPVPGFMGPVSGGYRPLSSTPMLGNFNPGYGLPGYAHEGIGVPSSFPFSSQGYFPPYGMPFMNSVLSGSGPGKSNQVLGPNPDAQYMPSRRNEAISGGDVRMPGSGNSELQRSTASSFSERAQGGGAGAIVGGGDAVPLFPAAPTPRVLNQPSRVIRVVPRNPRSATESASRILQSIQEERKQHEFT